MTGGRDSNELTRRTRTGGPVLAYSHRQRRRPRRHCPSQRIPCRHFHSSVHGMTRVAAPRTRHGGQTGQGRRQRIRKCVAECSHASGRPDPAADDAPAPTAHTAPTLTFALEALSPRRDMSRTASSYHTQYKHSNRAHRRRQRLEPPAAMAARSHTTRDGARRAPARQHDVCWFSDRSANRGRCRRLTHRARRAAVSNTAGPQTRASKSTSDVPGRAGAACTICQSETRLKRKINGFSTVEISEAPTPRPAKTAVTGKRTITVAAEGPHKCTDCRRGPRVEFWRSLQRQCDRGAAS